MIRPLRTYHFYLWRCLALTLPLIAILAVVNRPMSASEAGFNEDFHVEVLMGKDSMYTVQLTVLNALKTPTCVAFSSLRDNKTLLGVVDHRGQYDFVVRRDQSDFILKDVIHGNEILRKSLSLKK